MEKVALINGMRKWRQHIEIGESSADLTRWSSDISPADLEASLRSVGFDQIEAIILEGERPSYVTLAARRST
jgi:hypothetical protein